MKSLLCYTSVFWIVLTLTSCQNKAGTVNEDLVFRYNESANIQTLDPAFARNQAIIWPCNQLFNGLVQLDDSLLIQPDIAKNWSISEDGKQYRFTLRKDVFFHKHINFGSDSTRAVTASDFEYSFKRLTSGQLASPGAWIMQKVDSFKAENDSVFVIDLQEPFPAFLGLLSMKYASVVPKEVTEDMHHNFRSHPIGTGPFYFKFWEENVKMVLRKNPLYFEKDANGVSLPYLEAVAVTFLPDKQSSFLQFIQGNLDFISGLDPSYKDEIITEDGVLREKYQDRFKQISGPYLNTEYLGFNLEDQGIAQDIRIRRALDMGFDRKKMLMYLRNGMGSANVGGMIPKGLAGNIELNSKFNPSLARELIAEYKKETGNIRPTITLSTNASYIDIAEFLQREWQKLGIDVQVDVSPPSTLRQEIATGKVTFFRGSWIADYPDAENYLSLFYSKNIPPNGPNYTRFKNENYDVLYKLAYRTVLDSERTAIYKEMDSIIAAELPVIVLFYDRAVRFTHKNVENLGINPMNNLFLKRVKKQRG